VINIELHSLYACTHFFASFSSSSTINSKKDDASSPPPLDSAKSQEIKRKDMTHVWYIFCPIKAVWGTTDKCHVNTMTMMLWRWLSKVG